MRLGLVLVVVCPIAASANPEHMTHSGRLLDVTGEPMNGTFTLTFNLYAEQDDSLSESVWHQTSPTTVADGYYAVVLGPGGSSDLADALEADERWLGVGVAGQELGRERLGSVPYALHAATSSAGGGGVYSVYGTTSCGGGVAPLYTGEMGAFGGQSGAGGVMCLDVSKAPSSGWVDDSSGIVTRADSNNSSAAYASDVVVSCATCQGGAWVHWGASTCPEGWSQLYQGHIATFMHGWSGTGPGGGGPFCLADAAGGSWTPWPAARVYRARGGGSVSNGSEYQVNQAVRCSVCY